VNKLNLGIAALVVLLSGCTANQVTEEKYSGFLDNYAQLEANDDYDATKRYINPKIDFSSYKGVIIDKVKVIFPDGLERPDNQLISSIAKAYEEELKTSFRAKGYEVAQAAKPAVARIQAAITSVYVSHDDLKVYHILPIAAVVEGVGRGAGLINKSVRVMSEAKVTDSVTGELMASVIDLQEGKEQESSESKMTVDDVRPALKQWAKRFADGMSTF
jgi:hypothetical protein